MQLEELDFQFDLTLINLNVNSHVWLITIVIDSIALESQTICLASVLVYHENDSSITM